MLCRRALTSLVCTRWSAEVGVMPLPPALLALDTSPEIEHEVSQHKVSQQLHEARQREGMPCVACGAARSDTNVFSQCKAAGKTHYQMAIDQLAATRQSVQASGVRWSSLQRCASLWPLSRHLPSPDSLTHLISMMTDGDIVVGAHACETAMQWCAYFQHDQIAMLSAIAAGQQPNCQVGVATSSCDDPEGSLGNHEWLQSRNKSRVRACEVLRALCSQCELNVEMQSVVMAAATGTIECEFNGD